MPHSKTSWLYKIIAPGFLTLLAFALIAFSFLTYQANSLGKQFFILLLLVYFFFLIFKKYPSLIKVSLLLLLLFSGLAYVDCKRPTLTLNSLGAVKIYPDQVKIEDNWLSGKGYAGRNKILIAGNVNQKQKEALKAGKTVLLSDFDGEFQPIEAATNFGQFDYRKYYAGQKIWQKLKFKRCDWQVAPESWPSRFHYLRYSLQKFFAQMPHLLSFFTSELILAENPHSSDRQILANYRDLGVIHLLSISGLHVSIYTFVLSTIGYYLKRTDREVFIFCNAFLLEGTLLANNQPGFVRASLSYFLGGLLRFKKVPLTSSDLLGLTCLVHLLLCPRLFMNSGAILSYILVFGLQITNHLPKFTQSCLLNFLLTPLLFFNFYQVNVLTVFFNLLIVPYFNYFILPVTFFNLLMTGKVPALSRVLEKVLENSENLIGHLAQSKLGLVTFGKINWWQCLLLLIVTSVWLAFLNERPKKRKVIFPLEKLLLLAYLGLFLTIHCPLNGQVTFIDVGQGDSILFTTPLRREVYMIDTGGKLNFTGKKVTPQIEYKTLPFLKAQGINHLDGLFVTHQDADHVGDLGPLLKAVHVKKLYMAQGLIKNPSFRKRIDGRVGQTQLVELLAGMHIKGKQIDFQVLYPFQAGRGKNEDSLCLTTKIKNRRWLFTGDLGQEGEKVLMQTYPNLRVDYFKLGHHGSRTASNPEFLAQIAPRQVFISAGRNNRFGHPHPETLATLRKLHLPWVSTQDCGMISWYYNDFQAPRFKYFLEERSE